MVQQRQTQVSSAQQILVQQIRQQRPSTSQDRARPERPRDGAPSPLVSVGIALAIIAQVLPSACDAPSQQASRLWSVDGVPRTGNAALRPSGGITAFPRDRPGWSGTVAWGGPPGNGGSGGPPPPSSGGPPPPSHAPDQRSRTEDGPKRLNDILDVVDTVKDALERPKREDRERRRHLLFGGRGFDAGPAVAGHEPLGSSRSGSRTTPSATGSR